DRPVFVFLEGVLEAVDRLGVSDQLAKIPTCFNPRPERTRVRELPQELVSRFLERHFLQDRILGVEQDSARSPRRVEPEHLVRLLDPYRFLLSPVGTGELRWG